MNATREKTTRSNESTMLAASELTDEQLDRVAGGGKSRSQEAFDILIDHGDELTFKEQAACVWVWLTGGVVAGPNGEGDYRPHGDSPNPF